MDSIRSAGTKFIVMAFASPTEATLAMYAMEQRGMLYSTYQILGADGLTLIESDQYKPSQGYPQGSMRRSLAPPQVSSAQIQVPACSPSIAALSLGGPFSGTFRNPQPLVFLKSIAGTNGRRTVVQLGGVLQYKLEVYCYSKLRSRQGTALQMDRVPRYKLDSEVYYSTFRQAVRVGVS